MSQLTRCYLLCSFLLLTFYSKSQNIPEYVFSGGKAVVGLSVWQLDAGVNASQSSPFDTVLYSNNYSQYINLKYGVTERFHLGLSYNYSNTYNYVSDVLLKNSNANSFNLTLKWAKCKNYTLQLNLGGSGQFMAAADYNSQLQLIAEHAIGDNLTWQNNVGISTSFDQLQPNYNYLSGLTYGLPINLDLILEVYGNFSKLSQYHYSNLGLGYYFSKNFMTELYVGYGRNTSNHTLFSSINFYYRLIPNKD